MEMIKFNFLLSSLGTYLVLDIFVLPLSMPFMYTPVHIHALQPVYTFRSTPILCVGRSCVKRMIIQL